MSWTKAANNASSSDSEKTAAQPPLSPHKIILLVDVRSSPYSRYASQFNREPLVTSIFVEVSADYRDVYGTKCHDEFRVDLAALENIRPGTPPVQRIADAAPKLADELRDLNRNLSDLTWCDVSAIAVSPLATDNETRAAR